MDNHRTIIAGDDVESRVKKLLMEHLGVEGVAVQPDSLLVPDHDDQGREIASDKTNLGADSLDIVELVMAAEEEFVIEIHDDEAEKLNTGTVADFVSLITGKLAAFG